MQPKPAIGDVTTPTVTWLIATHVANDQLKIALQSCLDQTFKNFECLVVANGESAHKVADQVRSWFGTDPRLRVVTTEVRHLNFSLSLGLHLSRSSLVARMDADDVSSPLRLEQQLKFMIDNPGVAVLGSNYDVIDADGRVIKHVEMPTTDEAIKKKLYFGNPFCHPSVMLRRDTILKAGGYLGGPNAEDYDLWARLARQTNIRFANLPARLVQYRSSGVGTARRARTAYATMGGSQFANFVAGAGWQWAVASLISWGKALLKGR